MATGAKKISAWITLSENGNDGPRRSGVIEHKELRGDRHAQPHRAQATEELRVTGGIPAILPDADDVRTPPSLHRANGQTP